MVLERHGFFVGERGASSLTQRRRPIGRMIDAPMLHLVQARPVDGEFAAQGDANHPDSTGAAPQLET